MLQQLSYCLVYGFTDFNVRSIGNPILSDYVLILNLQPNPMLPLCPALQRCQNGDCYDTDLPLCHVTPGDPTVDQRQN